MMKPKIRFKGFEDSWIGRKLTDVVSLYNGLTYTPNSIREKGTLVLRSSNVQDGEITLNDNVYVESSVVNSPNVEKGDIIVVVRNGSRALIGKHAQIKNVMKDTVIGAFMAGMRSENPEFTNALLGTPRFDYEVGINLGATINQITNATFHSMSFGFPSNKEQKAIGKYFTSLDSQISASTSRLASLKQMKAASLQAMFPQEGETVPKIRFKGFEGEWKKVMFSETFEFLKNNSLSRAELSNEGDIVNVHYGDVLIKYGDLLNIQKEELTFIADNKIGNTLYNSCHLQNGDIIIADAAEDNTVGKCSEIVNICNKRVVSGLHTIPCRPLNRFAQGYLGHYINSESYHNQLLPLIQGSKISSISKKTLSQTIVLVPSIEEQKCIGNYFTSLDRQISLQSQRLEKLKQIKSACLDKMFV